MATVTSLGRVLKSPLDSYEYEAVKLENGLKVLLISTLEKAPSNSIKDLHHIINIFNKNVFGTRRYKGHTPPLRQNRRPLRPSEKIFQIAFSIGVGFMNDTVKGIVHYLEHILFFGSQKYPEYEGFSKFVERHDGQSNAVTFPEITIFDFFVNKKGWEEALDRFVDLMVNPEWETEDCNREIDAVESEFWMRLAVDGVRELYLSQLLSNPDHPLSHGHWGTGKTLGEDGRQLRQEAKNFIEKYYCASNASVVVVGPASLKTLRRQVTTYFQRLRTGDATVLQGLQKSFLYSDPVNRHLWNKTYILTPSRENDFLILSWRLRGGHYQKFGDALMFLSYIMRRRHKLGLENQLRSHGWIREILIDSHILDPSPLWILFGIKVYMTESGLKNYEAIISHIFQFLQTLRTQVDDLGGVFAELRQVEIDMFHFSNNYLQVIHNEKKGLNPVDMHNLPYDRGPLLKYLGERLLWSDEKYIPRIIVDTFVSPRWTESYIPKTLDQLLDPRNANLIVGSDSLPINRGRLHHYYVMLSQTKNLLTKKILQVHDDDDEYIIPGKNTFVPIRWWKSSLKILKRTMRSVRMLADNARYSVLVIPENRPRYVAAVNCCVTLMSDVALMSMISGEFPKLKLLWACCEDIMEEILAQPLAGFTTISRSHEREDMFQLKLCISCPTVQLVKVFKRVIKALELMEGKVTEQIFKCQKESLLAKMEEKSLHPLSLTWQLIHELLDRHSCPFPEYIRLYQDSDFDLQQFKEFIKQVKSKMRIEVELEGDVTCKIAHEIIATLRDWKFTPAEVIRKQSCGKVYRLKLPQGQFTVERQIENFYEAHHWVTNYYQIGDDIVHEDILLELEYSLQQEALWYLRGEKQIGYDAIVEVENAHNVVAVKITVYGLAYRFSADYIEDEIDEFMKIFYKKEMKNAAKFKILLAKIKQKNENITGTSVKRFFEDYLLPSGTEFRKVSFHILGHADAVPREDRRPRPNQRRPKPGHPRKRRGRVLITKFADFKRDLSVFPSNEDDLPESADEEQY